LGKLIAITSGKGGTGKTTTAGAVASCLAALGYKTVCVDGDVGLKNLDITLGMSYIQPMTFFDVIEGRCSLEDAVEPHPSIENLYLLTAPLSASADDIDREKFTEIKNALKDEYDFCIIDSPAGLGTGFLLAAEGADLAIIVATVDSSSVRDAQCAADALKKAGVENIRLLVNRVRKGIFRRLGTTVDDIIDDTGLQLIGVIPEDKSVVLSSNSGIPLVLYEAKSAAHGFLRVAKRLAGQDVPLKI
jgi:septum site-determining protein MinD